MKLPDLQFVWRKVSSGAWIGTLGIGHSDDEVVGFEQVTWFVGKDESLVGFAEVGLFGFVNED